MSLKVNTVLLRAVLLRATFCLMVFPVVTNLASGQVSDPIPDPIEVGPLAVGIEVFSTLPDTTAVVDDGRSQRARINFFRESNDGRKFVNDLRGQLYELDSSGNSSLYADVGGAFTRDIYTGSLASGFTSFDFHPDFANNGLFYTIHTETPTGSPTPDSIPATYNNNDVNFHTVVTEWNATSPSASTFDGSQRELLRVGMTANNAIHPLGDVSFNPTANVGDADYGKLYISGGDWSLSTLNDFDALQRTDTLAGTMLRIDPTSPTVSGGTPGEGDYTIPDDNPFVDQSGSLGEIFAYGFRNTHRISWDENGNMFGFDIGEDNLEEINIIKAGLNYGWGEREGTFVNGQAVSGDRGEVYEVTDPDPSFIDPVAQYDHDEGSAIAGGFAYSGNLVPELEGMFIFGDIVNGRLFYSDLQELLAADDGDPSTVALIQELQLFSDGNLETMRSLTGNNRVDLRLGQDASGEIFILSKSDGVLRRFVTLNAVPEPNSTVLLLLASIGPFARRRRRVS